MPEGQVLAHAHSSDRMSTIAIDPLRRRAIEAVNCSHRWGRLLKLECALEIAETPQPKPTNALLELLANLECSRSLGLT